MQQQQAAARAAARRLAFAILSLFCLSRARTGERRLLDGQQTDFDAIKLVERCLSS